MKGDGFRTSPFSFFGPLLMGFLPYEYLDMISVQWVAESTDVLTRDAEKTIRTRTFRFDEKKSWKRDAVRGHDIAEMIAESIWKQHQVVLTKISITAPEEYRGEYLIWNEPIFLAKRTDMPVPEPRKKAVRKH
jgi:hypothetical protein